MSDAGLSRFASTREMPLASRAFADSEVEDLVIPRTFQPRERNLAATDPP